MEKMTILSLLRQENNAKPELYLEAKPSYCTLLEKDIMIRRTAEELLRAARVIMRALNYKRLRRLQRENTFIADIYYEADPDIAKEIFIVGEFSSPQWICQIPLEYSYFHRAFRARVKIKQGSEFKFIVDGTFICCPKYPRLTRGNYTNNIFKNNPNPSGFNKSFHYKGVRVILNEKQKWMVRRGNSELMTNIGGLSNLNKKMMMERNKSQLAYFSPEVSLARPRQMNFGDYSYFNSLKGMRTDNISRPDTLNTETKKKDFGIGMKHLHSQNSAKTPLQTIQNPLKSMLSNEHNQSSRNHGSEYSDDDLLFLDEFFSNMPFTPDVNFKTNQHDIHVASTPSGKDMVESYFISGQGFRLSKSKKPCQDSFFTTKLGLGIADGVGGWTSYGIDPSSFSNSLMSQCKQIIKRKEFAANPTSHKSVLHNATPQQDYQQSPEGTEENTLSSQGKDFSKMESAFGGKMRPKIRRIRSSFHLDEKELKNCKSPGELFERSPTSENACGETPTKLRLDPQQILRQAYKSVKDYGSSTACLGLLENKTFKISNIGDSSILILRYNLDLKTSKIILRTEEQQHNFNAPFQLANIPTGLKPTSGGFEDSKRKFWKDKVSDAVVYQTNVKEGDIIIAGTDGLFDNLYTHEVVNIIDIFMNDCFAGSSEDSLPSVNTHSFTPVFTKTQMATFTKRNAKLLAHDLVKEAKRKSKNKACSTPFADRFNKSKVKKDKHLQWKGGKPDDICAVVGFVKKNQT